MSTELTLDALGFEADPFSVNFESSDLSRATKVISRAIAGTERKILQIVAPHGTGKSRTVELALPKGVKIVQPLAADRQRLRIGAIEYSFITDLSEIRPKHSAEERARQVRKIIGETSQKHKIVLVLENSHLIHHMTVKSTKTLLEYTWMGKRNLFTILLLGQYDALSAPGMAEIRLRSDTLELTGLAEAEIYDYIDRTVGRVFEPNAITAVAQIPDAKNYLNLQDILIRAMKQAVDEGRTLVTALDVFQVSGGGVKAILEKLGMPQADLARKAGISASELNRHLSGERQSANTKSKIDAALSDALAGFKPTKATTPQEAPRKLAAAGGG